jgi:hypothetical protein
MPASTGPLQAPNFRLLFASRAVSYFGTSLAPIAVAFAGLGSAIAGWVGTGIGNSTYLLVGAIWIVVTTVIVVSVPDVREFRLRPSLQEPDLAASVAAS